MMKRGTKKIEKALYRDYLKKSTDFYRGMKSAMGESNWNSVGLEAVHCAISANDALLTYFGGIRSVSKDHKDAVRLMQDLFKTDDAKKNVNHLRRVIAKKNVVEYENRSFTRSEAEEIFNQAERFLDWVKLMLPEA